jgi:hypothetical protein
MDITFVRLSIMLKKIGTIVFLPLLYDSIVILPYILGFVIFAPIFLNATRFDRSLVGRNFRIKRKKNVIIICE